MSNPSTVALLCFCGMPYVARVADIKRGWAKTCSKSCAAVKREYKRPNARHMDGSAVKFGKKYQRPNPPNDSRIDDSRIDPYQEYGDPNDDPTWDAHKDWK